MSDSIIVRVTLDAYDMASTGRQTQVYVQIPEVARASWLLPEDRFHGLVHRAWPEVLDVTHDYVTYGGAASNSSATAAWKAVMEWLRDAANRDEMQAAYELDQARRSPITRKLLEENGRLLDRVAELETEREKLIRWHGEDSKTITRLVARVERRRAELVAFRNDALSMRGSLSPADGDRKVPFELGETLTPAVDWLINRVTELEVAAVEGRAALAAFCHDHQDPGTAALGALYLLQQATPGTPMEPGETVPKVYRASHDSIVMGLYTTAAAARAHCEAEERRSWGESSAPTNFDWIEDEEDGVAEMTAFVGGEERTTGYVVTPLEVAAAYDPDGDE